MNLLQEGGPSGVAMIATDRYVCRKRTLYIPQMSPTNFTKEPHKTRQRAGTSIGLCSGGPRALLRNTWGSFVQYIHGSFAKYIHGFFAKYIHGSFAKYVHGSFAKYIHGSLAKYIWLFREIYTWLFCGMYRDIFPSLPYHSLQKHLIQADA